MPSLEIIADQVKCTHGATVADLAGEEIFYLQSRGISVVEARKILIGAFVTEMTQTVSGGLGAVLHHDRASRAPLLGRPPPKPWTTTSSPTRKAHHLSLHA